MKRTCILILMLFTAVYATAQVRTNIRFEKDTVQIGELNNLTIEIVSPRPEWVKAYTLLNFDDVKPSVSFYQNDTLDLKTPGEFDYLDINTAQPVLLNSGNFERRADGMYVHQNSTRFVAWDIGIFRFPSLNVEFDTTGNQKYNLIPLEASDLVVRPPEGVTVTDTTQMLAPILPIIKSKRGIGDFGIWFWIGLANLGIFLVGIFLYFYLLRKKEKQRQLAEKPIVIRPAHEVAFEKLDALDEKQLWQQGKIKEYQTELTYTVREYLENRFGIQALESTTGEINRSLKEVDFDSKHSSDLNNILQIADMVKFAKAEPDESIHQEFMTKARSLVKETLLIEKEDDGVVE